MKERVLWVVPCLLSIALVGCTHAPRMPESSLPERDLRSHRLPRELLESVRHTIDVGRIYEVPDYACNCIRQVKPNKPPRPGPALLDDELNMKYFKNGILVLERVRDVHQLGQGLEVIAQGE